MEYIYGIQDKFDGGIYRYFKTKESAQAEIDRDHRYDHCEVVPIELED